MRFIMTDGDPPSLDELESAVRLRHPDAVIMRESADGDGGDLLVGDVPYAVIERSPRNDLLCQEDLDELREELLKQDDPNRAVALNIIDRATGMVVVQVLRSGHEDPEPLAVLWDWLFAKRQGLLQVDLEGFFDRDQRVVALL
ncbi:MAG: hypothetical protein SNJ59_07945 [Aggregatilineales bacterium]